MNPTKFLNSLDTLASLPLQSGDISYFALSKLPKKGLPDPSNLPKTIKILIEAVLRRENGVEVTHEDVLKLAAYDPKFPGDADIPFLPVRVLMQDFTGVPALVDLAAMRGALQRVGRDPQAINPLLPADLIIDHSVQVDKYGSSDSLDFNAKMEFERNRERYEFLHWGQKAFKNLRIVPPASGICHQVNLEYLATIVARVKQDESIIACPDTLVGTDSHTRMVNGMGVLGWGVGGIEAEAALLGQPVFMLMPEVIGVRLTGELPHGSTATDLVLQLTERLRKKGVVNKFVEYFGPGLPSLSLPDRATVANMTPEYGATCGFFPVDKKTLDYLKATGRSAAQIDLVERYCKEQGLFVTPESTDPLCTEVLEFDLTTVLPCIAGPKKPQERIVFKSAKALWNKSDLAPAGPSVAPLIFPDGSKGVLKDGDVVIAAITSCTNTSNPWVMLGAGLLAKKAIEAGLVSKPHVKTSLAPGSKVVTHYLKSSGLDVFLEKLGFYTVGYGCTTCIGNSGPLPVSLAEAIEKNNLTVFAVLSGNRNFEGRINAHCRGAFLGSPLLVIAYALSGTMNFDFDKEPLGIRSNGREIFLSEIWPTDEEIRSMVTAYSDPKDFEEVYSTLLSANQTWNAIPSASAPIYDWKEKSTYLQEPPFFKNLGKVPPVISPIQDARVMALFGNSVTTDHISPAGAIAKESPAGRFLIASGVSVGDFNSYGTRRGNDRVMTRGTFANTRLKNLLLPGSEGGVTLFHPTGEILPIYDAAQKYQQAGIPTIILAGTDYGMGSSRDWAAKGTLTLGIKAVLAESFERIHRSNLVGMGILPLQFLKDENLATHHLTGFETFSIPLSETLKPKMRIPVTVTDTEGITRTFDALCRIDSQIELEYFRNGGILHYILRRMTYTSL